MDKILERFQAMMMYPVIRHDRNIRCCEESSNDEEKVKFAVQYLSQYEKPLDTHQEFKSAKKASEIIEAANKNFSCTLWQSLVKLYDQAVLYAPADSCELARAFGNRSAALYNGGLFEESILDIERALNIGYADNTKAKLYIRKAKCLLSLGQKRSHEVKEATDEARKWLDKMDASNKKHFSDILDKLSANQSRGKPFERADYDKFILKKNTDDNKKILHASSAVELKYSKKFGRHVVATRDIEAGETLVYQRSYASLLYPELFHTYCWNCSKRVWAGVPCHQCVNVIYCNESCRDMSWREHHDIECPVISMVPNSRTSIAERMVLRIVVKAYKEAGTLENLKENLAKIDAIKDPIAKTLTGGVFDDSKYASVYALSKKNAIQFEHALLSAMILHRLAATTEIVGEKITNFDGLLNNQSVRFLGGFILKNYSIHMVNSIGILINDDNGMQIKRGGTLNPFISMLNHSCDPTVIQHTCGDMNAIITTQRIKKGEQIFLSYHPKVWEEPTSERRFYLLQQFGFSCECTACVQGWGPWSRFPSHTVPPLPSAIMKELQRIRKKYSDSTKMLHADINDKPSILSYTFSVINFYQLHIKYPTTEVLALKKFVFDLYSRVSF